MYDFSDELKLQYKSDSRKDYMGVVDEQIPGWIPAEYSTSDLIPGVAFAFEQPKTPRQIERKGKTFTVPHQKYIRGIDPNGFIHPVTISTARPGPPTEDEPFRPTGDDGLGTAPRVMSEKQMLNGWLWVEPGSEFRGLTGPDYFAWAFAVRDARKKAYEAKQAEAARDFQTQHQALMAEQMKNSNDAINRLTEALTAALSKAK